MALRQNNNLDVTYRSVYFYGTLDGCQLPLEVSGWFLTSFSGLFTWATLGVFIAAELDILMPANQKRTFDQAKMTKTLRKISAQRFVLRVIFFREQSYVVTHS